MMLRSFLVGGAIALRASAFLVVPEIEGELFAPDSARQFEILDAQQQQIVLFCTECPFREVGEDGKVSWTDGFDTSLSLNFSIENGFLMANGRQIFPPGPPTPIDAIQTRQADGEASEPIPLGYALEVMPLATPSDEPGAELLNVRFTVLDLDSHPVPLDTVVITLIQDTAGQLYIANTDVEDTTPNVISWKQCRGKPKCLRKLLFGRMRALIAAAKSRMLGMGHRLSGFKGCHGGPTLPPAGQPKPHDDGIDHERFPFPLPTFDDDESPVWPGDFRRPPMEGEHGEQPPFFPGHRGHSGRPHRHHHMHHMHHGAWERTLSRVVRFIVVPAVLGVLAGLAASALGMLVGQVVVFLWLRYRRAGSGRSAALEQGTEHEKQSLITETSDDLPPQYTDESAISPAGKN